MHYRGDIVTEFYENYWQILYKKSFPENAMLGYCLRPNCLQSPNCLRPCRVSHISIHQSHAVLNLFTQNRALKFAVSELYTFILTTSLWRYFNWLSLVTWQSVASNPSIQRQTKQSHAYWRAPRKQAKYCIITRRTATQVGEMNGEYVIHRFRCFVSLYTCISHCCMANCVFCGRVRVSNTK